MDMFKVPGAVTLDGNILETMGLFMKNVEETEMVDLPRSDLKNGSKVGVVWFKLRPGGDVRDTASTGLFEIVEMMEEREGEGLCLIKIKMPPVYDELRQKVDLDLKMTASMRMSRERMTCSSSERMIK